jgi:hypothetical protein
MVAANEGATANLDMVSLPTQVSTDQVPAPTDLPSAPATATTINHEAIGCFIAGQFPLVDAKIEPSNSVARARVYFKAASASAWFYVEMTPAEGGFVGKLPRPKITASPITYYLQATTTEFGDTQTAEILSKVVEEATDCESDKRIAPIGPPGEVTVFSAATGSAVAPAGFAAGGLALTAGTLVLVLGGAVAAGVATVVVVTQPSAEPPVTQPPVTEPPSTIPTPVPPSPSPTPEPEPEPSPSPVSGSQ